MLGRNKEHSILVAPLSAAIALGIASITQYNPVMWLHETCKPIWVASLAVALSFGGSVIANLIRSKMSRNWTIRIG